MKEYKDSLAKPQEYWGQIAEDIVWTRKWDQVLDDTKSPFTKWFVGGKLSLCYNAVDRHVDEGRGQTKALVWDSPITGQKSVRTYKDLQTNVSVTKIIKILPQGKQKMSLLSLKSFLEVAILFFFFLKLTFIQINVTLKKGQIFKRVLFQNKQKQPSN